MQLFPCIIASHILCKIFAKNYFFTHHLKHKTLKKKTLLGRSQQSLANYMPICTLVEELSNCYDYLSQLSGFPDLLSKFSKVFLSTFKFSQYGFSNIPLQC